jgi:hypothetical protein
VTALRRLLPLLAIPLAGCFESRLDVEILTQIHADGTCTRRVEYRLEQVDPEKGNARVAIQPDADPLRLHRFPTGEPWLRTEETDVGHRDADVRRAYRELLAEPFAREVAALAERPLFGPRERRELNQIYERLDAKQNALLARLVQLAPTAGGVAIGPAANAAMDRVGTTLLESLEAAGLPFVIGQGELKLRLRATLVMPVPIVSANACMSGDTAVWEFDQDDLYGRGFEMKASAAAR